jgi:hypothetical protein
LQEQYWNYLKYGFVDATMRMYLKTFTIHTTEVVTKKIKNLKHEKSSRYEVLSIGYFTHFPLAILVVGVFSFLWRLCLELLQHLRCHDIPNP